MALALSTNSEARYCAQRHFVNEDKLTLYNRAASETWSENRDCLRKATSQWRFTHALEA